MISFFGLLHEPFLPPLVRAKTPLAVSLRFSDFSTYLLTYLIRKGIASLVMYSIVARSMIDDDSIFSEDYFQFLLFFDTSPLSLDLSNPEHNVIACCLVSIIGF